MRYSNKQIKTPVVRCLRQTHAFIHTTKPIKWWHCWFVYLGSSSELDVIKTAAFGALIPSEFDPLSNPPWTCKRNSEKILLIVGSSIMTTPVVRDKLSCIFLLYRSNIEKHVSSNLWETNMYCYVLYIHVPLCARLCLVSLGLMKHALRMFYKLLQKRSI